MPPPSLATGGDGNYQLRRLHWRHWNSRLAKARGTAYLNDCIPFCYRSHFHAYRVRVEAYRIRRCGYDAQRYRDTRVRVLYPGRRPAGVRRAQIWNVICARQP